MNLLLILILFVDQSKFEMDLTSEFEKKMLLTFIFEVKVNNLKNLERANVANSAMRPALRPKIKTTKYFIDILEFLQQLWPEKPLFS